MGVHYALGTMLSSVDVMFRKEKVRKQKLNKKQHVSAYMDSSAVPMYLLKGQIYIAVFSV